jgi:hypothetical protein
LITPELKKTQDLLEASIRELQPRSNKPLWPAPYNEDTPEAAYRFLTEACFTFNEADGGTELIPDLPFIPLLTNRWHKYRAEGRELIIQKSRRLVVSWTLRGLELWSAGLTMQSSVVCGLNYAKASEHGWRYAFILRNMKTRCPSVYSLIAKEGGHSEREGNYAAHQLEQVILPNGSLLSCLNQEGTSFQGSGFSIVTMEELCLYKDPLDMRAQAKIVTEGKAGSKGGFVVSVSNASPNPDWLSIKS